MKTLLVIIFFLIFCLVLSCLFFFFLGKGKIFKEFLYFSKKKYHQSFPIDFVYTWVDMDPTLRSELSHLGSRFPKAGFTDHEELKYSFRSVVRYAPWYHRIYLVVRDGQRPLWLQEHPNIQVIYHSQIIPAQYLPTYNSLAIETFLHKIPHLKEHFVYFNDDFIVLKETTPHDFFDIKGRPIESICRRLGSSSGKVTNVGKTTIDMSPFLTEYQFETLLECNVHYLQSLLRPGPFTQSQHVPSPNRRSYLDTLDDFLEKVTLQPFGCSLNEYTKWSKTRRNTNVARMSLIKKYWNIHQYGSSEKKIRVLFKEITHLRSIQQELVSGLSDPSFQFLCIQNSIAYGDANSHIGERDYLILNEILGQKWSQPSPFENSYKEKRLFR